MTLNDINNFSKIEEIVKNNFDLDKDSLKLFQEKLYDKPMFDFVKKHLDKSLRKEVKVKKDDYKTRENFDTSWKLFKEYLFNDIIDFIEDQDLINRLNQVNYQEYSSNRITFKKQEYKLYKLIYKNINIESKKEIVQTWFQDVDTKRLPNKDLYLVITFNYADWFLSATSENWSSCLNLESTFEGSFWSSLPGLITDINRGMLYITDKKQKTYHGITVDRIIARSWFYITNNNKFLLVRFYPVEIVNQYNFGFINKLFPEFDWTISQLTFFNRITSKEKFRMLKNNHNETLYPFQDISTIKYSKKDNTGLIIINNLKGNQYFESGNEEIGKQYFYTEGLTSLINNNNSIGNFKQCESQVCAFCEEYVEDEFYGPDGELLCENCFHENFFECEGFNEVFPITPAQPIEHNNMLYSMEYYNSCILREHTSNVLATLTDNFT